MEKKQNLSLIQALRGIAALLVLFHHGAGIGKEYIQFEYVNNIFSAGWIGVDFFFVLSGFIIYYMHSKDIGKREKVKIYYLKRFLRVYPIYWIITIGLTLIFFLVPSWGVGYETKPSVIIKSMLLFPQANNPIVNVGWSLVHEVFFYLMFSLIIFLKPKYSSIIVGVWILGIVTSSFGIVDLQDHLYLNFIFNNYNLEFLFGCFAGHMVLKGNSKFSLPVLLVGVIGFIVGWYFVLSGQLQKYHTEPMLVFGLSCALIVFSASTMDLKNKLKAPRILRFLGDASYSIYLTHFYVFVFLYKILAKIQELNPLGGFLTVTGTLVITTLVGIAFYLIVEKPIQNYLKQKLIIKNKKDNVTNYSNVV